MVVGITAMGGGGGGGGGKASDVLSLSVFWSSSRSLAKSSLYSANFPIRAAHIMLSFTHLAWTPVESVRASLLALSLGRGRTGAIEMSVGSERGDVAAAGGELRSSTSLRPPPSRRSMSDVLFFGEFTLAAIEPNRDHVDSSEELLLRKVIA